MKAEIGGFGLTLVSLCAGIIIILCLFAIVYLVHGSKPVTCKRTVRSTSVSFLVSANRTIRKATLLVGTGEEEIRFEREKLNAGQTVEFVCPYCPEPAKLTIEEESGHVQTFEI